MVKRSAASLRKSARALMRRAKGVEKKDRLSKAKRAKAKRAKAKRHAQTRRRAGVRKGVKYRGNDSGLEARKRLRARNATKKRSVQHRSHRLAHVTNNNVNQDVLDIVIMGHGLAPNDESSIEQGHLSGPGHLPGWASIRGMNSAHLTDTTDKSWETDWYNSAIPGSNARPADIDLTTGTDGEILTETVSDLRNKGQTMGTTIEIAEGINSGMKDSFHLMNTKPYGASKTNVLCFLYEPDSAKTDPDPDTGHLGSSGGQVDNWAGIYNVQFKPSSGTSRGDLIARMAQDPQCNVTSDILNKLAEDDMEYRGWHEQQVKPGGRGYVFAYGEQMAVPLIRIEEALVALHPHVKRINFYSHLCLGRWDGEKVLVSAPGGVGFGNLDPSRNDISYNVSEAFGRMSTGDKGTFPKGSSAILAKEHIAHSKQDELSRFGADQEKRGDLVRETIAEIASEQDDPDDDDHDIRMRSI